MDTKQFLEQLLNSGRQLAEKGQAVAEDKLNIPQEGAEREQKLSGLKQGALMAAVLTALIGTRGGRKLTGTAIKLGGLAALGGIAYKAYQNWRGDSAEPASPIHQLDGEQANERSLLLIQAMVAAANADGHIDAEEQALIRQQILDMDLPESLLDEIKDIVKTPPSVAQIAAKVDGPETAGEVYLAARLLADPASSIDEKQFLDSLVIGLNMDPGLRSELDNQLSDSV